MVKEFKYIIVGGGLAGASAVEGIREHDPSGTIALLGKESRLPYDRPPLSKGLWLGKAKLDDLPVHDAAFYESQNVLVYLNTEVKEIDPSKHQVLANDGTRYAYAKLLIATGGSPRKLPFGDGVLRYFRSVEDYLSLKEEAERAEEFIVIGGGFIGGELGAALTLNNKKVTMVFPDQTILRKVLPSDLSSFVTDYYRSKGVTIMNGERTVNAEQSKSRTTVTTQSGKNISVDVAIAAIGLDDDIGFAKKAGLTIENGIAVNNLLQSSNLDIFAAGDVANFPAISLDRNIRLEHWNNAQAQGKHAGKNMAGASAPFEYLPYFYSDLFDLGFEAVGDLDSRMKTHAVWQKEFREGVVYYLDNDLVKGVLLWNVWEKIEVARRLISLKRVYKSGTEA
ncbi:MAG: FAD/NAD(P)-binding oxidoreductase [bacterium]